MNTVQADAWKATVLPRVDAVRDRLVDIIKDGTYEEWPEPREPTKQEKIGQDRRDGNFLPTPHGRSRSSGPSDPTLAAVLRWETDVEEALTLLLGTVGEVDDVIRHLGVSVLDGDGWPVDAPELPLMRSNVSGRWVACVAPARALKTVREHCGWLTLACGVVVERALMSGDADRALYVERLTHVLAKAVGVVEPRRCVQGCGRSARRPVCDACQKRSERKRRVA